MRMERPPHLAMFDIIWLTQWWNALMHFPALLYCHGSMLLNNELNAVKW